MLPNTTNLRWEMGKGMYVLKYREDSENRIHYTAAHGTTSVLSPSTLVRQLRATITFSPSLLPRESGGERATHKEGAERGQTKTFKKAVDGGVPLRPIKRVLFLPGKHRAARVHFNDDVDAICRCPSAQCEIAQLVCEHCDSMTPRSALLLLSVPHSAGDKSPGHQFKLMGKPYYSKGETTRKDQT